MPPGVIGIVASRRTRAQAANASTAETSVAGTSSARSETSRTRNTLRLPARDAAPVQLAARPAREPGGKLAHVVREPVCGEGEHEAGDDDPEHRDADEG